MDIHELAKLPEGAPLWYRLGTGYEIPVTLRAVHGASVEVVRADGSLMTVVNILSGLRVRQDDDRKGSTGE